MRGGRFWAAILVSALALGAVPRRGFELISQQEYDSELALRATSPAAPIPRALELDAPTITVVKPSSADIAGPVDIDVRFKAAAGANVDVSTLKITYGVLRLDITRRILQAPGVKISAAGLSASGAQLPKGNHRILIEIADNHGRTARQQVAFTVQ
jgi:hypothetical protein